MFVNQQNAVANFEHFKCVELLLVPKQVFYKYCDKSFITLPRLIKKTYREGTRGFYRFACMIVVQSHISLNDKTGLYALVGTQVKYKIPEG